MERAQKTDLSELIRLLGEVEGNICRLDSDGNRVEKIDSSREALKSFCTRSATLGLNKLELAGHGLESCLDREIAPNNNPESVYVFGFAISTLIEELKQAVDNGDRVEINVDDVIKALEVSEGEGAVHSSENEGVAALSSKLSDEEAIQEIIGSDPQTASPDFSKLQRIVSSMGGSLIFDEDARGSFQIRFAVDPFIVEKIETLLTPCDPDPQEMLAPALSREDSRFEKILGTIKDFMKALSSGDVPTSQDILLSIAEQQYQAGLYNEIGLMARELHNSLNSFAQTLDPALKEMVEHKIPDSGSRLEHILELTETAANTTLDHVEEMQRRNHVDHEKLLELNEMLQGLHAVGESAREKLEQCSQIMAALEESSAQTRDDLVTVLTAQDYQDLTGQIIQKIITLLKDIERKLVRVIRAFGAKSESKRKAEADELYGPAHKGKAESLHSQDDVDSLLAEFGF